MENKEETLLVDIGNTHFHIFDGEKVEHLLYDAAVAKYKDRSLYYISVKHALEDKIIKIKGWKNISDMMAIENEYDTMGVDRKALCLSHREGIFIDAGSAITIDVVEEGKYLGGFILPGLKAYINTYKSISPILDIALNKEVSLDSLPSTTKDGISYGIIASIKALIDKHADNKILYFTGGDGEFLHTFFEDAIYDEMLVFNGMQQALKATSR
ncbi:type III pantothenate kinase [Sulfurovum sp.]|uniref:type III pantothenate kinase n=1 Tax=Sulfurovum sp. TaxID=1969726 RepID=UPI002867DDA3|nr:type III pantothenate kinase [Sulfurovum sp.]